MRDFVILLIHLIVTVVRLGLPGGLRSVLAQSVLVKNQLLILYRLFRCEPKPEVLSIRSLRRASFEADRRREAPPVLRPVDADVRRP